LPPVNTSSCPEIRTPNTTTLPGYLNLVATSCVIYPSVQNCFGVVVDGKLEEYAVGDPIPLKATQAIKTTIKSESEIADDESLFWSEFLDPCIVDGVTYTGANLTNIPGGFIQKSQIDGHNLTGPKICLYELSIAWRHALRNGIGTALAPSLDDCTPSLKYTNMTCYNTWWMDPLYNQRNASLESVSQIMDRMAKSVTDQLRLTGTDWNGQRTFASGAAYRTDICNHFIWQWMFFPLLLLLSVAIFLAVAIIDIRGTPGRSTPVWKSSILPVLFYGLEEGKRLRSLAEDKELGSIAKAKKTRFGASTDGWRIIEDK
jgi:hypothetical protein